MSASRVHAVHPLGPGAPDQHSLEAELFRAAHAAAPGSLRLRWQRWSELLLSQVAPRRCPVCDQALQPAERHGFCPNCSPHPAISFSALGELRVGGGRFEGALRDSIHQLKYLSRPELAVNLAEWMCSALLSFRPELTSISGSAAHTPQATPPPRLVAVPLHRQRLVERGYNQAGLLATALGARLRLRAWPSALRRTRATAAQARLGAAARAHNIADAFQASPGLAGQRIILVDDVATTGATLSACAAALEQVRAQCLGALVVAIAASPREP